ncbi:MAG: DUF4325 domain-containing protein [Clostridia bacterium]|nr:DUF4325 domain-containing protein [Clostridia bacterium]
MKYSQEKKNSIIKYLLEKINQNTAGVSKIVSETFGMSRNTVNGYINELIEKDIIKKKQRDVYELIDKKFTYALKRSEGHLDNDTYAYYNCLEPHIKDLPENVQRIWSYSFSEMINNVMDHSMAEDLDIVILRNYLETTVFIKDNGVGIFEKIKAHFELPSLDEAICELFKGKLTTDAKNHSGEGIFFSSKLMDSFFIISSNRIFMTDKFEDERIVAAKEKISDGTVVIMKLSNFSNKQAFEIFDDYSNDFGCFTKTRIPLKNIFTDAPVSRSQANRVCNRLDKFKEVVIDFDGLDWMGQGFAHQMFVVYKNEHPEIEFIPVNMNEAVTKMYNHVTSDNV